MPSYGRGIEENIRAEETRNPRCLGIPLVPAYQHTDVAEARVPDTKAARLLGQAADRVDTVVVRRIAGGEVVLLVIERVIGDVHFPIHAQQRPVPFDDGGRVPVDALRLPLEDRNDEDDPELFRDTRQRLGGWPGDRLRDV